MPLPGSLCRLGERSAFRVPWAVWAGPGEVGNPPAGYPGPLQDGPAPAGAGDRRGNALLVLLPGGRAGWVWAGALREVGP